MSSPIRPKDIRSYTPVGHCSVCFTTLVANGHKCGRCTSLIKPFCGWVLEDKYSDYFLISLLAFGITLEDCTVKLNQSRHEERILKNKMAAILRLCQTDLPNAELQWQNL